MKIDLTPLKIVVLLNGNFYNKPDRYYPLGMEGVVLHIELLTSYARDLMNRGKVIDLLCNSTIDPEEARIKVRWANDSRVMVESGSLIFRRGLVSIINPLWDFEEPCNIEIDTRPVENLISNTGGRSIKYNNKKKINQYDIRFRKPEEVPIDDQWHKYVHNGESCEALRTGPHTVKIRPIQPRLSVDIEELNTTYVTRSDTEWLTPDSIEGYKTAPARPRHGGKEFGQSVSRTIRESSKLIPEIHERDGRAMYEAYVAKGVITGRRGTTTRNKTKQLDNPYIDASNYYNIIPKSAPSEKSSYTTMPEGGSISIDIESLPENWAKMGYTSVEALADLKHDLLNTFKITAEGSYTSPATKPQELAVQKLNGTISEIKVDTGVITGVGITKDVSTNDNNTIIDTDELDSAIDNGWWDDDLENDPDW